MYVHRPLFTRPLITAVLAAHLLAVAGTAAAQAASGLARSHGTQARAGSANRPRLPDSADWQKIQAAARLRATALAPHRTARFRAFAAQLGLRQLISIRPLAPGRCALAVRYLYNNLLDLENAFPGEDWRPLRRLVAKEPSIQACTPPAASRH